MNNKIKKFRSMLAVEGIELTVDQATELYHMAKDILKRSKKLSQLDLWKMQDLDIDGMSEKEKEEAIGLYQHVRDLL